MSEPPSPQDGAPRALCLLCLMDVVLLLLDLVLLRLELLMVQMLLDAMRVLAG